MWKDEVLLHELDRHAEAFLVCVLWIYDFVFCKICALSFLVSSCTMLYDRRVALGLLSRFSASLILTGFLTWKIRFLSRQLRLFEHERERGDGDSAGSALVWDAACMPTCLAGMCPAPGGLHRMVHASLNLPQIFLFVCVFWGKGQVNSIACEVWNTMLKAHANATWAMCSVDICLLKHLKAISYQYWGWRPFWCKRCVPVYAEDGF